MDNRQKRYEPGELEEPDLKQYYKEYHLWLKDFEKTDEYNKMVVDYKKNWIELHKHLRRIFEHTIWLEKYGYWLTEQYLTERRYKKITVYDSYTLESDDDLSYYKE